MMKKTSEKINDFTEQEHQNNADFWKDANRFLEQAYVQLEPKLFQDGAWFEVVAANFFSMKKKNRTQQNMIRMLQFLKWTAHQLAQFEE